MSIAFSASCRANKSSARLLAYRDSNKTWPRQHNSRRPLFARSTMKSGICGWRCLVRKRLQSAVPKTANVRLWKSIEWARDSDGRRGAYRAQRDKEERREQGMGRKRADRRLGLRRTDYVPSTSFRFVDRYRPRAALVLLERSEFR